jgi:NAD(P)H-nitrite reductase large subunit
MVKSKTIVCRCLDVTEKDILEAIHEGYDDLQKLKRYCSAGTGPCQGKACLIYLTSILARTLGVPQNQVFSPMTRPPVKPVMLGVIAGVTTKK